MVRFIDLFSGTGGIRLALQQALDKLGINYECVKSAEIDKKACETYELNFNENPFCDVTKLEEVSPFDILLAGFPCQSFSYAGKQLGFCDTRGTLFFDVERLINKYRPSLCILENVRGLTTHDQGRTFNTILTKLKDLGYFIEYRILNSSNFGLPQNRVRVYILASLSPIKHLSIDTNFGSSDSHKHKKYIQSVGLFNKNKHANVIDILEDNPDKKYDCSPWFMEKLYNFTKGNLNQLHGMRLIDTRNGNSIHSWNIGVKGECSKDEIEFMDLLISNRRKHEFGTHQDGKALAMEQIKTFYKKQNIENIIAGLLNKGYLKEKDSKYNPVCGNMSFEVFKFLDPNSISITLTASDTHKLGIYHNGRLRRLTPRECARLQGYPESYLLHPIDTYAYKQLGNAVSVPVLEELILDFLKHNENFPMQKIHNYKTKHSGRDKANHPTIA